MARKKKTRLEKEADPEDAAWDEEGGEPPPKQAKKKKKETPAPVEEKVAPEAEAKKKKKKRSAPEVADDDEAAEEPAEEPAEPQKKKQKKKDAAGGEEAAPESESGPGGTVFVGGIPWSVTEEAFREDFTECGEISDLNFMMNKDTGLFRGTAFVTFLYKAGVDAVLAYDGTDYGGRRLKVNVAEDKPPGSKDGGDKGKGKGKGKGDAKGGKAGKAGREKEVFIKGLPMNLLEGALKDYFEPCGAIENVSMPLRDDGKCKGFAWIVFSSDDGVEKAAELNGKEFAGKRLLVERAGLHIGRDDGAQGKGKEKGKKGPPSELEVFVKNLPFDIDEPTLQRDFAECGEIERINVPMKDQDRCMGFAWITFKTKEAMVKAIAFDGDDYGGRRLIVEQSGKHKDKGAGKGKDA